MSLYDRVFKPRTYTLSDGTVVKEKRSRAPIVILIVVALAVSLQFSVLVWRDFLCAGLPPTLRC